MKKIYCRDTHATEELAAAIAVQAGTVFSMTLVGDLGAGKTTFARGFLRALGHRGAVKSPTYTIVEPYDGLGESGDTKLFHFDFYRINHVEELELMGIRDYFAEQAIILIEWPERSGNLLPEIDLACHIKDDGAGRMFSLSASTEKGEQVLLALNH